MLFKLHSCNSLLIKINLTKLKEFLVDTLERESEISERRRKEGKWSAFHLTLSILVGKVDHLTANQRSSQSSPHTVLSRACSRHTTNQATRHSSDSAYVASVFSLIVEVRRRRMLQIFIVCYAATTLFCVLHVNLLALA